MHQQTWYWPPKLEYWVELAVIFQAFNKLKHLSEILFTADRQVLFYFQVTQQCDILSWVIEHFGERGNGFGWPIIRIRYRPIGRTWYRIQSSTETAKNGLSQAAINRIHIHDRFYGSYKYILPHYASVNWVSIGSDNGLSPDRCQAVIWTNAGILLFGPLGTNLG